MNGGKYFPGKNTYLSKLANKRLQWLGLFVLLFQGRFSEHPILAYKRWINYKHIFAWYISHYNVHLVWKILFPRVSTYLSRQLMKIKSDEILLRVPSQSFHLIWLVSSEQSAFSPGT